MTTLDEKALEAAAKALATHWRTNGVEQDWPGYRDEALAVIRAYLDARPPATQSTGFYLDDGSLVVSRGTFGKLSEGIAQSEGALIPVEIREVRNA